MRRMANITLRALLALCLAMPWFSPTALAEASLQGFTPRQVGFHPLDIPGGTHPLPESVPAAYAAGTDLAVWEDTLAFVDYSTEPFHVRVFVQRDGEMRLQAEYPEEAWVSDVIYDAHGLAYLSGGPEYDKEIELVTVGADGVQNRLPLGPEERENDPYVGPLLRLADGRLLVADGAGRVCLVEADGRSMRRVSDIPVRQFVYFNEYIYFTNTRDLVEYRDVYIAEWGETIDVAYPRLYRMWLDGSHMARITDGGVLDLASRGPYILYQNIDDPFVLPSEFMGEALCGVIWCYNGLTGERRTLAIDCADYMPTPYGPAAWLPEIPEMCREDGCPGFGLVLHDWSGKPLYRLDARELYWGLPFYVSDDGLWLYTHDAESGEFEFMGIPLDGSSANWD